MGKNMYQSYIQCLVPYDKINPITTSNSEYIIYGTCVSSEVESLTWMKKKECERVLSSDKMKFVQYIEKMMVEQ